MKHRIVEELHGVATFVAIIWAVFVLNMLFQAEFNDFGLSPRSSAGLTGIVTMPFLHGGWNHLIGNTVPLVVLLCLLAGSRASTYRIVPQIVVLGGTLLWVFGTGNTVHVGASGLIYGLIAFLIVAGFREGRLGALAIAVFVGFTYGATLIGGVLPTVGPGISWDGHLTGAIAGGIVARISVTPDRAAIKG